MSKGTASALGILGGISSLFLGIFFNSIMMLAYPELLIPEFAPVMLIFQIIFIVGGIISIIGGLVVNSNAKAGKIVLIIGALVSGVNIITLLGAVMIKQEDYY